MPDSLEIKSFEEVKRGDILIHVCTLQSFVVSEHLGETVILVRTLAAMNPTEWRKLNEVA